MGKILWVLIGLLLVGGCASYEKFDFDVSVKNNTDQPLTLWLTKDGPPAEAGWRSPESYAQRPGSLDDKIPGIVVPPGKTAYTGPIAGHFAPQTRAWLRVYLGQMKLDRLLAVSRENPARTDVALIRGRNDWVVEARDGKLQAIPRRQVENQP